MKKQYDLPCNIAQSLNLLGDRWTFLILYAVRKKHQTYKELQTVLKNIPTNLLSERLKTLCATGLLTSEMYQDNPKRYKYALTQMSKDLDDVFNALLIWGNKHLEASYKCIKHKACMQPLEIVYYCPICDKIVHRDDIYIKGDDEKS